MAEPELRRGRLTHFAWVAVVTFAASAAAVPELVGALTPPKDFPIPAPDAPSTKLKLNPLTQCPEHPPARLAKLPFRAGERLEYEADIFGLELAELESRVEQTAYVDGVARIPIFAEVHSDWTFRLAASLDAEMRTWLDPTSLVPTRNVWRLRARTPKVDTYARHDVAFADDGKVGVRTHNVEKELGKDEKSTDKSAIYDALPGVLDVLSAIYLARAYVLEVGTVFCFPIHLSSKVGFLRGEIEAIEKVSVDFDRRDAFRILLTDSAGRVPDDISVHAWISTDDERLPLRLIIRTEQGDIDLELDDRAR